MEPMKTLQELMTKNFEMNTLAAECNKTRDLASKAEKQLAYANITKNPYPATVEMFQNEYKLAQERYLKAQADYRQSQSDCQSLSKSLSMQWLTPSSPVENPNLPTKNSKLTQLEHEVGKLNERLDHFLQKEREYEEKFTGLGREIKGLQDRMQILREKDLEERAQFFANVDAQFTSLNDMSKTTKIGMESFSASYAYLKSHVEEVKKNAEDMDSKFSQLQSEIQAVKNLSRTACHNLILSDSTK
ncbi:hypothetical protein N7470_010231 [Penicillium chermesinum]|nr:hypothetical protein N7470_010231 [Penicillium chermesinum]